MGLASIHRRDGSPRSARSGPSRAAAAGLVLLLVTLGGCGKETTKPRPTATPGTTTASPGAGTYGAALSVTLATDRAATIHYSRDGVDPAPGAANTTSGASPIAGIAIPQGTTVLKFYSVTPEGAREAVRSVTYVVDATLPQISFTTSPGPFGVLTSATIDWHSDKGGSYVVELGGSGTIGSGTALASGTVAANATMSQIVRGAQLRFSAATPLWVYVTDGLGHVGSASLPLAMKPRAVVPLSGWLNTIAFDPSGSRAYVIRMDPPYGVSVLDTDPGSGSYNSVLATIPLPAQPGSVVVTPDGSRAYIPLYDARLAVLSTASRSLTYVNAFVSGFNFTDGVALTPDGTRAYCPGPGFPDGQVLVVDTDPASPSYHLVIRSIRFPLLTHGRIAITPDGRRAILNWGGIIAQAIDVIDTEPGSPSYNTVIASPGPLVSELSGGDVATVGNDYAYALSGYQGLVRIDLLGGYSTMSYAGSVDRQGGLALTPDGLHVLHGTGGLHLVDARTMLDEGAIDIGGAIVPLGRIAVTPDGTRAYAEINVLQPGSAIVCVPLR